MTLSEKAAYLKGLMEGLNLSKETDEGKMIAGIVDLLGDVTGTIHNLEENAAAVSDELDEIEDDLDVIEDYLMDEDDDEDDYEDEDSEEDYNDLEDSDYEDEDEETIYEVTCPTCGEVQHVDEETIMEGTMRCPKCNELLEFNFSEDEEEEKK